MAKFGAFNASEENFECYIERLESYFVANDVPDEKRASMLISEIGSNTYKLLKSLIPSPAKPKDRTYEVLKQLLTDHLMPKPLIIAERFKFWGRMQMLDESLQSYAAELRHLSNTCAFPEHFLDQALRDKFVHGIRHAPTQKSLLTKDATLTFAKALESAVAVELADEDGIFCPLKIHVIPRIFTNL